MEEDKDEPEYEAFLDAINGAISGNVFFLGAGFVWTPRHFWGFVSDYPVPDFERGVCVTSKSHMSQGQVAGVAVGVLVCVAVWIVFVMVPSNEEIRIFAFFGSPFVFALLFGLVFGLGSSKFFPVPKAACGSSSADYKLCDFNAQCMGGACVCNAGFHGSGISCSDAQALSLSLGVFAFIFFR
jgi:hypothetical protein